MAEEVEVRKEKIRETFEHNVTSALIPSANWLTFIGTIFGFLEDADVANQSETPVKNPKEHSRVLKEALGESYIEKHRRIKRIAVLIAVILGLFIVVLLYALLKVLWIRILLVTYILPFIVPTIYTILMVTFVVLGAIDAIAFRIESIEEKSAEEAS